MKKNDVPIRKRKAEHIDIVLNREVSSQIGSAGFDRYRFQHEALPEINFEDISLSTHFLGKTVKTPFLISSMTGGTEETGLINQHLAQAAEERGWAMGLGSMRVALEIPEVANTFQVRKWAPSIPLLANLGAVQLNKGIGIDECRKLVDLVQADALVLHLNSMQEVFQPEGDLCFAGLLQKIEQLCRALEVPVGVKEVGWGIHGQLAKQLESVGVAFIDVAGAGGTSWSQVEKYRVKAPLLQEVAETFADWGIPTAECVVDVRKNEYTGMLIASGGLQNGLDAAKAIALGADCVGFGRSLLSNAVHGPEEIMNQLAKIELELKITLFGIGIPNIPLLKGTERLKKTPARF